MTATPTPPAAPRATATPGDRWLLVALCVGLALLMARAHVENVDHPRLQKKLALHEAVLENRAPDPYQYKLWTISWAVEGVARATGLARDTLYGWNGFLSLLALLAAHARWLSRYAAPRDVLLGTLLLAALAHGLFLDYYHHPYDLWGVAGFCLLLAAVADGAGLAVRCGLGLAVGLVWEKHALVPAIWGLHALAAGRPFLRLLAPGAAFLASCLVVPVTLRLALGTDRPLVDETPLAAQEWGKVLAHQLPYVLPFAVLLGAAWRRVPRLVRLSWLYVPVLYGLYAASEFILHELRSFWAFAPVFTATTVAWARALPADAVPHGGPEPRAGGGR
ncbi:MAG: hypothetical protein IT460_08345 [Planctomycetes bacterium]|nr:hypothetical protein [Planctomycetota bacterium]